MTQNLSDLADIATSIACQESSLNDVLFATKSMVHTVIPHRKPLKDPDYITRRNGDIVITIRPGVSVSPRTGECAILPYPTGSIPRLILFWLQREIVRNGSRRIMLGRTLADFLREIGLDTYTGRGVRSDAVRLRDQLSRLLMAEITISRVASLGDSVVESHLPIKVSGGHHIAWSYSMPDQGNLFSNESWLNVGQEFFELMLEGAVPLDARVISAIQDSPLALDLYPILAYRTHGAVRTRKSVMLPWASLASQLGADYSNPKNFKKNAKIQLRTIMSVWHGLSAQEVDGGVLISPRSQTPLPLK